MRSTSHLSHPTRLPLAVLVPTFNRWVLRWFYTRAVGDDEYGALVVLCSRSSEGTVSTVSMVSLPNHRVLAMWESWQACLEGHGKLALRLC